MRNFFCDIFLYNPLEPTGASPAASPAPAASTPPGVTPPAAAGSTAPAAGVTSPSPTPAVTSPTGTVTSPGTTTPAAAPSWLDGFRKEGVNFATEDEARTALLQSYRDSNQLRPLAPALSQYQQHQKEFQEFLDNKKQQTQQQKAKEDWTAQFYQHPEWDANWVNQVKQDANGNLIAAPGAPADVVLKYQHAQAFRQQQVEKLISNPFKFLEPGIRHIAQEIAKEHAQQNIGQYKEQQDAQAFIQKNSGWIYDVDANGNIKTERQLNPQTGQYQDVQVLSKWGNLFREGLAKAAQQGVPPQLQQEVAYQQTRVAYMSSPEYIDFAIAERAKAAGTQTPAAPVLTPREQANAAFTQRANPATPPAPPTAGGQTIPTPEAVNGNNLADVMLKRFRAEGITAI